MKKTISGIRGIVGDDFTLGDVLEFSNNFSVLIESKKCVIGRDTRPSSESITQTAISTLMKNGIDVLDLGISPTPVVFHEARKQGAGMVITSSHNPLQWNGMKFILNGRGINEQELSIVLDKQTIFSERRGLCEKTTSSYIDDAKKIIGKIEKAPKIVIDIGGGATKDIAPKILSELGCSIHVINEEISKSSRGPDPTADDLTELITATKGRDIGFAYDLDGDRLVIVINGKKQTPDVTLGLGIAKSMELGCKKFVLSIDSSIAIEKYIQENGGTVHRSKVGEANVIDLMIKTESQAGGEGSSGGFILPEFNFCRDGILTSGLIASMLEKSNFKEILNFMNNFTQTREKIRVNSNLHDKVIEQVRKEMEKQFSETNSMDGIKGIIDENSWVLVRKSNTEDTIRVSAESDNVEKSKKITNDVLEIVKQCYDKVR